MSVGWIELLVIVVGFLLLIVVAAIVALIVFVAQRQRSTVAGRKPCPYCAELIKNEAKVCRYCGRDLPASE
ncbi:MAG: zinc ribbon domain-containing protein [Anaerolineae bacterium]